MTYLIGSLLSIGLLLMQLKNSSQLINPHSLLLVVGGMVCVTLLLSPWHSLVDMMKLVRSVMKPEGLLASRKEVEAFLRDDSIEVEDPYEIYAQARDLWEMNVSDEEFERTLTQQAESVLNQHLAAIAVLRNLGKYPPALGMVGTVIGMIDLFAGMGLNQQSQIGSQLAMAMTATLYGLLVSNFVMFPLADRLEAREESRRAYLERTIKLLLAVQRHQPSSVAKRMIHAAA